jgi:hypothetical protein
LNFGGEKQMANNKQNKSRIEKNTPKNKEKEEKTATNNQWGK